MLINIVLIQRALLSVVVVNLLLIHKSSCFMPREQLEKTADGFRKSCVGKTGADMESVQNIRIGVFDDDPKSKCYVKCVLTMGKAMDKQGRLIKDMIIKQVPIMAANEDMASRMINGIIVCHPLHVDNPDPCDQAYQFTKCLQSQDPEVYFFP